MVTFEIPAVKSRHSVEVNWTRYRGTSVTDPALIFIDIYFPIDKFYSVVILVY